MADTYTENMGLRQLDPNSVVDVELINDNSEEIDRHFGGVPLFISEAKRDASYDQNTRNFIFCVIGNDYTTGKLYMRYGIQWLDFTDITGPAGPALNILGNKPDAAALPASGNTDGDAYITDDDGHLHTWNNSQWNDLGRTEGPPGPGLVIKGNKDTVGDLPSVGNEIGDSWVVDADSHLYAWDALNVVWNDAGQFKGDAGRTLGYGSIDPISSDGNDGDFWINTASSTLSGPKAAGAWPAGTSLIGDKGDAGSSMLSGIIDPENGDGVDGDFWINTSSNELFGPKDSGTWPAGVKLIGPSGIDGSTVLSGTVDPTSGDGEDGDFWINFTGYVLFGPKDSGTWPVGYNLKGGKGEQGSGLTISGVVSQFSNLPSGQSEGTIYLASSDNNLYIYGNSTWNNMGPYSGATNSVNGVVPDINGEITLIPADINAATAVQGNTADNAVQPADLATIATTGKYSDLQLMPAFIAAGSSKAIARNAIGAGTSNLVLGTTSLTALKGDTNIGGDTNIVVDHGTTSGTVTLDASAAPNHIVELNGAATIVLSGVSDATKMHEVRLFLSANGNAVTWPSSIVWANFVAPSLFSGIDEVTFTTVDGGSTVLAVFVGQFGGVPMLNTGDPFLGGFFTAIMDPTGSIIPADDSQTPVKYVLIISDKSLETSLTYKEERSIDSYHSDWDGLGNTEAQVADAKTFAAAEYCDGLSIPDDGGSKYYLPSRAELLAAYWAFKPTPDDSYLTDKVGADFPFDPVVMGVNPYSDPTTPAFTTGNPAQTSLANFQSGGSQALAAVYHWTSTEFSYVYGWRCLPTTGAQIDGNKTSAYTVRPFRRIPL